MQLPASERTKLLQRTAEYVGGALTVDDPRDGWPGLGTVGEGEGIPAALHIGRVGLSHRDRDDVERRFQNPGLRRPLIRVPGYFSLLLGVWESDQYLPVRAPILVLADAERRVGHMTRVSIFAALPALLEAQQTGWATHFSDTGERILWFRPELLPIAAAVAIAQVEPDEKAIQEALRASGYVAGDDLGQPSSREERLRRAVTVLVRDAQFRGAVLDAYGRECAMCGLGLSLVEGAHIYPASAPGSVDTVSNGLALCANHHRAFDRHQLAVIPEDMRIVCHSEIRERATENDAAQLFVKGTYDTLRPTERGIGSADPNMLQRRYEYYSTDYEWLLD